MNEQQLIKCIRETKARIREIEAQLQKLVGNNGFETDVDSKSDQEKELASVQHELKQYEIELARIRIN